MLLFPASDSRRVPCRISSVVLTLIFPFLILTLNKVASGQQNASVQGHLRASYGRLPLAFEANVGQAPAEARYLARGGNYLLMVGDRDAVLSLQRTKECAPKKRCALDSNLFHIHLLGAEKGERAGMAVLGEEMLPGKVNTLLGNDPAKWHTGATTYRRVRIAQVYPGIDQVYYGDQERLEYDFDVAPGADPKAIRFRFTGGRLRLNRKGDLVATVKGRDMIFRRPVIYQRVDGEKKIVAGGFVLEGRSTLRFRVGRYDRSKQLVIDPVLSYSTYINGTGGWGGSPVAAVAVDSAGEAFITGAASAISPTSGAFQQTDENTTGFGGNAYVMKLNASGTDVIYATYLGGSGGDQILPPPGAAGDAGMAIAVDASGDAYLTGFTYSLDFPLMNPVQPTNNAASEGNEIAFITELNPTGSGLVYSTYMGGSGSGNGIGDIGTGIAVDAAGATYVTGNVASYDFPTTSGALQATGPIFITKLTSNGTSLVYTTCFATGYALAGGIAVDTSGAAYVTGSTFPQNGGGITVTPGAFQSSNHSQYQENAYVAKLNAAGTALVYATYLGGSGRTYTNSSGATSNVSDQGNAIAVDGSGNAYITGSTGSEDFPTTSGAIQTNNVSPAGFTNAFVTKLNPTGTALVFSTYLGGTGSGSAPPGYGDQGNAIAVDTAGDAYIAGSTGSRDFPVTTNAYQSTNAGFTNQSPNAFVSELNPTGSGLLYSTYLGGSTASTSYGPKDSAAGIAVDHSGHIYVGGTANSSNFPTTTGAYETTGAGSGFVSQLDIGAKSEYALSITPATLEVFANQVGTPSNATPVTITNIGSADVAISGISIAGTNAAEFTQTNTCGATLEPNGSCMVSLVFTPTTAGKQSATLSIADSAMGSPQTVAVVGNETFYPPNPVISPTQLDFGPRAVGSNTTLQATLTNQGTGPLTIQSVQILGFWWTQTNTCGTTLAAGASCVFKLTFTPLLNGSTQTYLMVNDDANNTPQVVTMTGSGVNVYVEASPQSLSFANQAVGTTSAVQTVTVTNFSAAPSAIKSIGVTGDFAATNTCNGTVPADGSCNVFVSFTPTANGSRTGLLTITDDATGPPQTVALTGTGTGPAATLSATTLSFPQQAVGSTSSAQTVTLTNSGQAALTIASITASGDFAQTNTCGSSLAAGAKCNLTVTFTPTATGARTGTLTITDNVSDSPQTVTLTGSGGTAAVTPSPALLSFGSQVPGTASAAQTVTLTNGGTIAASISSITASGDFSATNTCGGTIAAGGNCKVAVVFTPTATGARSGVLTVTDNAAGSPQTVTLSGTGATPMVTASPASLSFGGQVLGLASTALTVTLTNNSSVATTISSIAATGDFSETNTCNGTIAAGASCTVAVIFTPTAAGARSGMLTVTDDAAGSTQTVTLSGTGVAPVPVVMLAPGSLTFNGQAVGSTSAAQMVTLTNSGQAALAITSIVASGDFAETNTCGNSVAVGANCTISVTFTPTDSGVRSGAITVTDNAAGSPQAVALSGAGTSVGVTVGSSNLTISAAGGSTTDTITISSLQGFSGTVMLSCTVQAVGSATVHDPPTCSLNPAQAQVTSGSPVSATLTVATTAAQSSARPMAAFVGGGALVTLLLLGGPARWRRRLRGGAWIVLLLGLGALGVMAGCGGHSGHSSTPGDSGTATGSYQVVVTATSANDAKVTATTTIALTVQ